MRNALTDYPYVQPENSLSMYSGYIPKSMSRPISTITGKPEPTEAERFQLYENSLLKKAVNYLMQNALYKGQRGPPPEWIDRSHPNFTPSIYGDRELTPAMMEIPADPPNALRKVAGMGLKKVSKLDNALDMTLKGGKADIPTVSPKAEGGNPFKESVAQEPVYHGTNKPFEEIRVGDPFDPSTDSVAYFTSSKDEAIGFGKRSGEGKPRAVEAYLDIRNPLEVDVANREYDDYVLTKQLIEQAKKSGNDGVIIRNIDYGMPDNYGKNTSYIVFGEEQIKNLPAKPVAKPPVSKELQNIAREIENLRKKSRSSEGISLEEDQKFRTLLQKQSDLIKKSGLPSPSSRAGEPGIKGEP